MPLMLVVPRHRKYAAGDIIDEEDAEKLAERYGWAVAEVSESQAKSIAPLEHDPKQSSIDRNAAVMKRYEAVQKLLPKLTSVADKRKAKAAEPEAAPEAKPDPVPETPKPAEEVKK